MCPKHYVPTFSLSNLPHQIPPFQWENLLLNSPPHNLWLLQLILGYSK